MSFNGKVVLITGASSGIGAAAAIYFARHGATLSLIGRNPENLTKTLNNCVKVAPANTAPEPLLVLADVTRDAEKIIKETIEKFGKLDVLVNNAGIAGYNTVETSSLEEFDSIINTNLKAVYHLTMLAIPHLAKTQGNIVNVSSLCGIRTMTGGCAYGVSKAGLDQVLHTKQFNCDLDLITVFFSLQEHVQWSWRRNGFE